MATTNDPIQYTSQTQFTNTQNQPVTNQDLTNTISTVSPNIIKPSITLFEWESPERHFKKRDREFYRKIAIIMIFFALMLLVIKEFMLIGVLGVTFFAVYVFTSIEPRKIVHKITTNGVNYASQKLYLWQDLISFYIEKKEDYDDLIINTKEPLPGRLIMLLDKETDQIQLAKTLNEYISIIESPQKNIYQQLMDKMASRLNI